MTTPPQDPFGTPREGGSEQSGQPRWDQQQYGQPYDQQQYGQPYGQPQYGQPYGQPVQGYGPPQAWQGSTSTETKAVIALVCAVAAWVVFPLLPAIAALMIGRSARDDIRQSGGRLTGDGLVTATKWIAWANIVLCVLGVVLGVLAFSLLAVSPTGFS